MEDNSLISETKIRDLLPQKLPFVMVSHLLQYENDNITSGLTIKRDNIFIENGCFNESGLIENIAQTYALHVGYSYFLKNEIAPVGYIGAIKKVDFFAAPLPGEFIQTRVKIIQEYMNISLIEGEILKDNKSLMKLTMKTFLAD